MTLEQVKNELSVFNKYKFFEEDHYYECNGVRVGISATRIIEEYSQPFDQLAIAEKCSLKENKSIAEILEEWKHKNIMACDKGHFGHEYAQSLWSGAIYQENIKRGVEAIKIPLEKVKRQAFNFYNDYKDIYTHIQDEQLIGDEDFDIASAVDHLFLDKDGNVDLIDYKTNSYLTGYNKANYGNKKMLIPLNNIPDDSLHHYYLQLSIYKFIIEKYTNIKINKMIIVYMSENIDNYKIIEIPYLKDEVEKMLENRRVKKIMGKSIPVLVIGHSGSGKSTSLRNLKKEDYSLVNPLGKRLPFKGGSDGLVSSNYEEIKNFIAKTPKNIIVIDDSNYLLTMEMMAKARETGYNKFTDIAQNYWKLIEFIKNLDGDKRVYLMSHEEVDDTGFVGVKTVGKMLSNQCCVEGLYTIVLRAESENGKFTFRTHTSGNDIVKSPIGMFEEDSIDNDLKLVDDKICEYYEIEKKEANE